MENLGTEVESCTDLIDAKTFLKTKKFDVMFIDNSDNILEEI